MSQLWDHVPARAAEFPNDNPALHEGVSWVCLAVCGPAKPIVRPRATNRELDAVVPAANGTAHPTSIMVVADTTEVNAPTNDAAAIEPLSLAAAEQQVVAVEAHLEVSSEFAAPADQDGDAAPVVAEARLERLELELGEGMDPASTDRVVAANLPLSLEIDASELDLAAPDASEAFVVEGGFKATDTFVFDGALDDGAESGGPPGCVPEPTPGEDFVVAGLERLERREDVGPPPTNESPQSDAFRAFVGALVEILLISGATRAAAALPAVLESDGQSPEMPLDSELQRAFLAARFADESSGSIQFSAEFVGTARAWRDVLSGVSSDLSACGSTTLDGWASDLLKAFGVGGDGKMDVRRELRRRGVAAFGMLLAA